MSSIKKNFFYNIILSVTQVLFPLITFSYVARVIEPFGIGTVSFVESICRYAILIAALGIPVYGVREVAKLKDDKEKLSKLCSELLIIHFVATLFISLIYIITVFSISKLNNNLDYYLLGLMMVFSNVFIMEWYFQGIGDFKYITLRTLIVRIITTISVFFLVTNSNEGINFFLLIVFTNVINGIINFWHAKRSLNLSLSFDLKKHLIPLILIFSTTVFSTIYVLLDTIFLGFISNDIAVGLYSLTLKISKIPIFVIGSLSTVLIPVLSKKIADKNHFEFKRLIAKSINFVIVFSLPAIMLFISIPRELILVFAGKEFLNAELTLKILSPLVLIISLIYVFGFQIITSFSKDKYLTYSVFFGSIASISLNIFLIPILNENGAAISNLVAELIVLFFTIYFSKKLIEINFNKKLFFLNIIYVLPIYFIANFSRSITTSPILIIILTFLFSALYFIFYQVFCLKNEIINDIKIHINNLLNKLF